ncbi:hypothetical protein TREMEDRAFT_44583 [Tremella mesenterica DSM 1558]|uniref:uncharacterized protein n=1 Tax=Tremella mesenterica (strain ATCC 24925 / CBS 8224 / DSM 1558 / NBRC 9311 / NRRL Y-6157 / RJB 2259-6 / UBC 559-6) TaxID=578456 RepID=UPI0003F48FAB|nr:uncharacterized protein TREMEDRAFT_44583 [Tremella mesenterica DSM 1558]EIW68806.1 hypothetical protein TREMEDRAFT_44583 [Tremella mesenterica DSM 1558]
MARHKRGRGGATKKDTRDSNKGGWYVNSPADKNNSAFDEYYQNQGMVPEDEWEAFKACLQSDLPTTFRVTGSRAHAEAINDLIKSTHVPSTSNVELDGVKYPPPMQIPWYPGHLAWQISAPKRVIRKSEPFKKFQRFLVGETEVGNLSRQEAVSMIPPLLLDVESHHICLDMCAAPGSKTAQIIEALNPHHTFSTGMLIANDSDYKRTHMLVHQTGRLPSKGLIVTNLDAAQFPTIKLSNGQPLLFDRILADVPCSGDGTLRKNLEIWSKWGAADANSLHSLQLRILLRAMNLLRPGGRLVYSTCSFNPVEDEAVVAAALNSKPGFSLLDVSTHLPGLLRRAGVSSWKVATQPKSGERKIAWHENYESYREAVEAGKERDKDIKKGLSRSVWPPENVNELNLERCLRLLPHDQDTGGFFVCVLQKADIPQSSTIQVEDSVLPDVLPIEANVADETGTSSLKRARSPVVEEPDAKRNKSDPPSAGSTDPTVTTGAASSSKGQDQGRAKKEKRDLGFREDPYSYVKADNVEIGTLVDWFKLSETFPRGNLMVRNEYGDPLRTLYLTNDIVKEVLENNDYTRLRIVSAGVKAFVRQDSQTRPEVVCKWRVPSEGIGEVVPHMNEEEVRDMGLEDLKVLLEEQYPPVERFSPITQTLVNDLPLGNIIVRFKSGSLPDGAHLPMDLISPMWRAKTSLSLLIDKREKSTLSLRTWGEDICKPGPPLKNGAPREEEVAVEVDKTRSAEVDDVRGVVDVKPSLADEGS